MSGIDEVTRMKEACEERLLAIDGVTGVGIGLVRTETERQEVGVIVYAIPGSSSAVSREARTILTGVPLEVVERAFRPQ